MTMASPFLAADVAATQAAAEELFRKYPVAKWEAEGKPAIAFSVVSVQETYANRLVPHRRLNRDGARFDDTGSAERRFELATEWFNGNDEPGLKRDEQYPDELNKMCEAARVHETGTLTLPTRGPLRCRLETYRRLEQSNERDSATVAFVFVEDNEDDERASNFQAPSAKSALRPEAEKVSALAAKGGLGELADSIGEAASELQDAVNAPGRMVGGIENAANRVINTVEITEQQFRDARAQGRERVVGILSSPEDATAVRGLRRLHDIAKRAIVERTGAGAKVVTKKYPRQVSIFDVAAETKQPAERLIELNGSLPDVMAIPAGTPVRVFDFTEAA